MVWCGRSQEQGGTRAPRIAFSIDLCGCAYLCYRSGTTELTSLYVCAKLLKVCACLLDTCLAFSVCTQLDDNYFQKL
jgi:hypothetical protein